MQISLEWKWLRDDKQEFLNRNQRMHYNRNVSESAGLVHCHVTSRANSDER